MFFCANELKFILYFFLFHYQDIKTYVDVLIPFESLIFCPVKDKDPEEIMTKFSKSIESLGYIHIQEAV